MKSVIKPRIFIAIILFIFLSMSSFCNSARAFDKRFDVNLCAKDENGVFIRVDEGTYRVEPIGLRRPVLGKEKVAISFFHPMVTAGNRRGLLRRTYQEDH
jgi:hypothetical protein